jgi:hypothetical protein
LKIRRHRVKRNKEEKRGGSIWLYALTGTPGGKFAVRLNV